MLLLMCFMGLYFKEPKPYKPGILRRKSPVRPRRTSPAKLRSRLFWEKYGGLGLWGLGFSGSGPLGLSLRLGSLGIRVQGLGLRTFRVKGCKSVLFRVPYYDFLIYVLHKVGCLGFWAQGLGFSGLGPGAFGIQGPRVQALLCFDGLCSQCYC